MSNEIFEATGENKVANIVRIVGYAVMTLGGLVAAVAMFYWMYYFGWQYIPNYWVAALATIAAGAAVAGLGCFLVWLITSLIWKKK